MPLKRSSRLKSTRVSDAGWTVFDSDVAGEDARKQVFPELTSIFSVLLVVEGGPNTLNTVRKAVESNTPVVVGTWGETSQPAHSKQVIEGSGRVADLLSYAWRFLHDERSDLPFDGSSVLLTTAIAHPLDTTRGANSVTASGAPFPK